MVEDRSDEAENEPEELEPAEPQAANVGVTFEPAPEDDPEEFRFHTGTTHASKAPPAVSSSMCTSRSGATTCCAV